MRLTYKGDYAIKALLDLSLHYANGLVTLPDLARRQDIPLKFLEQVMLELKKGGFVESHRGKVGGYTLARHPSLIKLGETIRFVDGPLEPIACIEKKYSGCKDVLNCTLRKVWQKVACATSAIVDSISFEDLARQVQASDKTIVYSI